jgi:hypothetical protein
MVPTLDGSWTYDESKTPEQLFLSFFFLWSILVTATTYSIPVGRYSAEQVSDGLSIPEHDYVSLSSYSGANPGTIVFKNGGAAGQTVATLTLTYDGNGNLLTVTKS